MCLVLLFSLFIYAPMYIYLTVLFPFGSPPRARCVNESRTLRYFLFLAAAANDDDDDAAQTKGARRARIKHKFETIFY